MTAVNGPNKPRDSRQTVEQELLKTTLLHSLDLDERPSFAIRKSTGLAHDGGPLDVIYCNPALLAVNGLLSKVSGQEDARSVFVNSSGAQLGFQAWLHGKPQVGDGQKRGTAYLYEDFMWSAVTLEQYKIVSGMPLLLFWSDAVPSRPSPANNASEDKVSEKLDPSAKVVEPISTPSLQALSPQSLVNRGSFDCTAERFVTSDPHVAYFRTVDWDATCLGPMSSWTDEFRSAVNLTLNSGYPAIMFCGEDLVMLYNEPYLQLIGTLHPCMGQSIRIMAPKHWLAFEPLINHINKTGSGITQGDMPLFIDRHGANEETHWSFQLVPVLNMKGQIMAYYHSLVETTDYHLLKRRVTSLVEVGGQTAKARDFQSFWAVAIHTLTLNDKDVPFALLYDVEGPPRTEMSSVSSPGSIHAVEKCVLKGAFGVEAGHRIAPATIDMNDEDYILHTFFAQAAKNRKAAIVHLADLPMADNVMEGIAWKGYGDPCRIIIICPILPTSGEQIEGFIVLGMNPRRPFDEDYQQYVQVLLRLFASSYASVVLFDEEIRQREMAIGQAARIQEQLLAELQLKEKKFQRFAERSDVGIFIMDPSGHYSYRNDRWFELFPMAAAGPDAQSAWNAVCFAEEMAMCEGVFKKLVIDHEDVCFELKTRMEWTPPADASQSEPEGATYYRYILCSAYPELDADGNLVEVVGNVTDISRQKWAQGQQKLRTQSALESKQHLEHFIDTTSHEMRNPLSCILQCADGILCSSPPSSGEPPSPISWSHFMEQTLDAAQTIVQCAQHMRHIVDDILTISKLNSGLLVITPIDAQPEKLARHAVKMFEAEAKAAKVDLGLVVDKSYRDMAVDWVSLDPTRLLQILINLLTNAIKFTRLESVRHVVLTLSASETEPTSLPGGLQFNEDKLVTEDENLQEDWKHDPNLFFVQFSVKDTGRGLTEEERKNLFSRFSQASPRTHIHYGGSGLGLFISRRLTELQGGAIGLKSEPKRGSVFSFYIKTRRTKAPIPQKTLPMVVRQSPEDVRHRPDMGTVPLCQPPAAAARSESENARNPVPSKPPKVQRPTTLQRKISAVHSTLPPELLGLPGPSVQDLKDGAYVSDILHVLIVEDNLVNQRVLAKQLRNLGCVVSVANHGREALEFLPKTTCWNHEQAFNSSLLPRAPTFHIPSTEPIAGMHSEPLPVELSLILMDWEMPIMNGLTAVAKIRELEREGVMRGRVPVIGVTANVREQQIQTAIAAGMDDVVGKPFRVAELLARMKNIVGSFGSAG